MITLAVAAMICWLMVLVARPRKPLPGNEVQELVYSRLLGRQHLLVVLALLVTLLVVVTTLPQRLDADLRTIREARVACRDAQHQAAEALDYDAIVRAHCFALQASGTWEETVQQGDGSWLLVATLASPPLFTRP